MMGCVWGEGELWEQSCDLAILTEKKCKATEKPQNNNKKNIQECGLSLRHLIMGMLTNWREFRSKKSGEKRHQRCHITHRGRLGAEKSQSWRHFREEQVEASGAGMDVWDLAGSSTSAPSPPHSGDSLSSHFTALSRYYRISRENIHRDCQKEHP